MVILLVTVQCDLEASNMNKLLQYPPASKPE